MSFPSMLKLSAVLDDKYGDDLYIPFREENGVFFEHDNASFTLADSIAQYFALQLLSECKPENLEIKIFDPECRGHYSALHDLMGKCNIDIIDKQDASNIANTIRDRIKEVKFDILSRDYTTLSVYNSNNEEQQEPYYLYLIYGLNFRMGLSDNLTQLLYLMQDSAQYGIYFIVLADSAVFDKQSKLSFNRDNLNEIQDLLHSNLFSISIKNSVFSFRDDIYQRFATAFGIKFIDYTGESALLSKKIKQEITLNEQKNANKNFLEIPIGKKGKDVFFLEMGSKSVIYHGMIGGTSGSGKSYFINVILTEIAKKYSSDEIRLYLFDYKTGAEFRKFSKHPCLQYLMLSNNQTEEAINLFESLIKEMEKRQKFFGNYGSIDSFNLNNPAQKLPYILVIIDEFQELFTYARKIANKFDTLLNQIARRGRSAGVHLLFCSNSFNGVQFEKSTRDQVKLRIAFQMSGDRHLMEDYNSDFSELEKGEAIYNTNLGNPKFNNKIKVKYIGDENVFVKEIEESRKLDIHKNSKPFELKIIDTPTDEKNEETNKAEINEKDNWELEF